ncbi:NAD dependent epimerase/dehydratase [Trametes gibbosa]|nr:NAD dependent epimerase/dehydratase [Trametes gibbosa]
MPAIDSGKVLVTGANGFIAGWIIKTLLEHGFSVRGTVRKAGKGVAIKEALASYGDRFELAVVDDITSDKAFDQAVRGVDAIVHAASPVRLDANDPLELMIPAVAGTSSILRSASVAGSSVKRVIFVSSLAAVLSTSRGTPCILTEADWNTQEVTEVEQKGSAAPQAAKYRASKMVAEKVAWDTYNGGKARGLIGWDLVTLCPPWVFGPVLGAKKPEEFNFSMKTWYHVVVKEQGDQPTWSKGTWVDVRDFAQAHILALTKPEVGGERFIITAGPFLWSHWGEPVPSILDTTRLTDDVVHEVTFDATKSREMLGLEYRGRDETVDFILQDLRTKGLC